MLLSAHALKTLDKGCLRAFALRHKANRYWPADGPRQGPEAVLGTAFHALVHQHALGLDVGPFVAALAADAPRLPEVWARFEASEHATIPAGAQAWHEQALHFRVAGVAFMARLDRIVLDTGRWRILDWKTGNPDPDKLKRDWQARLYPFALAEAGQALAGGDAVEPGAIELVFWDVVRGLPIPVPYDRAQHEQVRAELERLVARASAPFDLAAADCANFPRKASACGRCEFNQLCNPRFSEVPAPPPPAPPRFVSGAVKRPNA